MLSRSKTSNLLLSAPLAHNSNVGDIVWLEHLNIAVDNGDVANTFYFDGLGFSRDHRREHFANIGSQQLHLTREGTSQVLNGIIGVALPDIPALLKRLAAVAPRLASTKFSYIDHTSTEGAVEVTCPWGNQYLVWPTDGPMAVRGGPGIRFVEMFVKQGVSEKIASFYQKHFSAPSLISNGVSAVCVGPSVHFVFTEVETVSDVSVALMKGIHAAVYIGPFERTYHSLSKCTKVGTNPRFVMIDRCDTFQEALEFQQYRFYLITDGDDVLLELEHETRSLTHKNFFYPMPYSPI